MRPGQRRTPVSDGVAAHAEITVIQEVSLLPLVRGAVSKIRDEIGPGRD